MIGIAIQQADKEWGVQSASGGIDGSLRVSLRNDFLPLSYSKGAREMIE